MAGLSELAAPFAGTVLRLGAAPGTDVPAGTVLVVLESMKMEHVIEAPTSGAVESFSVAVGDAVQSGDLLLRFEASAGDVEASSTHAPPGHVA
ncbi:MAG TPA: acetyl-CoA carboxylase biotin carboxyl carrier protein subunit, partial [Acidimicrobiales bacterium]